MEATNTTSKWTRQAAGHYTSGEWTIRREWTPFSGRLEWFVSHADDMSGYILDPASTLAEAKALVAAMETARQPTPRSPPRVQCPG